MIRIENLVKHYGNVRALDGLNLTVEPGVVYGFLGPNGAGKTTTMRILTGLARPDQGRTWILDHLVSRPWTDVLSQVGVLPEEPAFYPWMTPVEYLRDFIAPLYGITPRQSSQRVNEILDIVGLSEASSRRIGGFSRGMRQRLGLAQAVIHQPKVLLLDEPVSGLDPGGRKDVLNLIEHLRGDTTIFLSTHILADVERVCDVIGIIARGRLVIQDQREQLLERYASPVFEIEAGNDITSWLEQVRRMPFVEKITLSDQTARLLVEDVGRAQKELLTSLADSGVFVRRFETIHPSLEDVFLRLTGEEGK